jgi:hypothetical protein
LSYFGSLDPGPTLVAGTTAFAFFLGFPDLVMINIAGITGTPTGPIVSGDVGFRASRNGTLDNLYIMLEPLNTNPGPVFTGIILFAELGLYRQGIATDSTTVFATKVPLTSGTLRAEFVQTAATGAGFSFNPPQLILTNSNITPGAKPVAINQGDVVLLLILLEFRVDTDRRAIFPFNIYAGMTFS